MRARSIARAALGAIVVTLASATAAGCGGAPASRGYGGGGGSYAVATGSYGDDTASYIGEALEAEAEVDAQSVAPDGASIRGSEGRPMLAQAAPSRRERDATPRAAPEPGTAQSREQAQASETATDAVDTSSPLLIYTARFHLAVYEVRESQARIIAAARELGGFVFTQADDRLVVRVPAPRFRTLLEEVELAGEVEHRDVQAQDVSEEFHDVEIRIRNLEAMRARVEALLAQAQTVEDALRVEQQLQRITEELERLRGRQRFLADRVAFSTITVLFRPRPRELLEQPDVFQLPFAWLDQLGLSTLLDLR